MTPTTQRTNTASTSKTGLFATLRGLLSVKGTGASSRRLPVSVLATTLGALAFTAAPAQAEIYHPFLSSFNGEGSPAAPFIPEGVAVDDSLSASAGDVYVVNGEQHVVDKFDGSGKFVCAITGAPGTTPPVATDCDPKSSRPGVPGGPLEYPEAVAVDPTNGDLYVVDNGRNVVDRFGPEGDFEYQITGLARPVTVAVGGGGVNDQVYIVERESQAVTRFDPATKTLSPFAKAPLEYPGGVAVDSSSGPSSGDVYVVDEESNVVDKFKANGEYVEHLSQTPEGPFAIRARAVAVDPANGDVYVSAGETIYGPPEENHGVVYEFGPTGVFLGELKGSQTAAGSMEPGGVAVDTSGDVYVIDNEHPAQKGVKAHHYIDVYGPGVVVPGVVTGSSSEVGPTSVKLEGAVNPAEQPVSDCRFEYGTSEAYGQSAPCEPSAKEILPADNNEHAVTSKLSGLESGTTYHYRLEAANANGVASYGKDATVTTLPRPSIDSATATRVTAESAELNVEINPKGYDTTIVFEWGTSTAYGSKSSLTPEDIGAGTVDVARSIQLTKLEANQTYHWRVVATNANGTAGLTVDHTFIYDTTGGGLPDNRAYEMVSPPQKNGALLGDVTILGVLPEVSEDGSRVMTISIQCFAGAQSCTAARGLLGSAYLFARTGDGWQASALAPSSNLFSTQTSVNYDAQTGDALFSAPSAPGGQDDYYVRASDGAFEDIGPVTPPEDGGKGASLTGLNHNMYTDDYSHLVWQTELRDSPEWPFDTTAGGGETVYEYVGRNNKQPFLVGVSGGLGSTDLISTCGTEVGFESEHLSADGRTVYFTALPCPASGSKAAVPANELYARVDGELADAHTVAISERSPSTCTGTCQSSQPANAVFQGASADGSKALFTSTQRLTDEASEGQGNLYLYDSGAPAGHNLIDVSAGDSSGGGSRVRGVTAFSPDGSHVYFVAQGVLTGTANQQGQSAQGGSDNLYVFERDAQYPNGRVMFIATLPALEYEGWNFHSSLNSANVTPEGRYLVFKSSARLTPDDTSLSGAQQVFRYDAQTGELLRISVGNDGFNDNGNRSMSTPCPLNICSENARIVALDGRRRSDPTMSNDGSYVFFESPVGLTPQALDDVRIGVDEYGSPVYARNVYEWHEGHVSLISDGRDVTRNAGESSLCASGLGSSSVCLLGSDATGANVFFATTDQLVPQDTDTQLDYYDARICTTSDPCIKPSAPPLPPCLGETCHGTPAGTPLLPATPSATFNGQGNLTSPLSVVVKPKSLTRAQKLANALGSCRKKYKKSKKRRAACEKSAHQKYGAAKKTSKKKGK